MLILKQRVSAVMSWIEKFFLYYILVQPFLDVLSYFGISISIFVRVIVLGLGLIYLFYYESKQVKWMGISYSFILGIFLVTHTVNNLLIKEPYFLMKEVTYSFKIFYVLFMLIIYFAVFNSIINKMNWEKIVQRNISINLFFISLVIFLAEITNTGNVSYSTPGKEGHAGWFYSPNDQSAVMAMAFGILMLYFLNRKDLKVKLLMLPAIVLVIWSMLTIGTKVALFSLIAILSICLGISIVRKVIKKVDNKFNLLLLVGIFILTLGIIPITSVGNNMNITYPDFSALLTEETQKNVDNEEPIEIEREEKEEIDKPHFTDSYDMNYKVFSGRDDFFRDQLNMYKVAPISQKLFGMGPGGNYEENLKIVEMDFFDWFFGYGLIGFCLFILPILYFGIMIIKGMFQYKFKQVDRTFLIIGTAIVLGLGVAFIAGHILMNPASGIYFSILLAYLLILAKNKSRSDDFIFKKE
jgi:hypothetical protein